MLRRRLKSFQEVMPWTAIETTQAFGYAFRRWLATRPSPPELAKAASILARLVRALPLEKRIESSK
jgi:hypothetical protein